MGGGQILFKFIKVSRYVNACIPYMILQNFYCKGPQPLLGAISRTACGKITISTAPNRLNYCGNFVV